MPKSGFLKGYLTLTIVIYSEGFKGFSPLDLHDLGMVSLVDCPRTNIQLKSQPNELWIKQICPWDGLDLG